MSAVAYMRRSSAPNVDTRTVSFEMQESEVRSLAKRNGDAIDRVLSDWARSGGSANRPGYQQLLDDIDSGRVKTIYSYSLSRLSRSLVDFADLIERCKTNKVRLYLVKEGAIDWTSAAGRGFAAMTAVFAQMERELATERIQSAVDARRERGDHLGQAPYGFRVVAGRLVERDDEDPEVVVAAFREAGSFGGASRLLNARGVPTRRKGTMWNHGVVADIVRLHAPGDAPVALKRARAKPLTGTMFAGLLRCGSCTSTLTPRRFRGVTSYYCSRSYRIPDHGKTTIREAAVLPWVQDEAAHLGTPDKVTVEEIDTERTALDRRRDRVLQMFEDGDIDRAQKARRLHSIDDAAIQLEARVQVVQVPEIDWANWDPDDINRVLRSMWSHVQLDERLQPIRAEWLVPEWRAP